MSVSGDTTQLQPEGFEWDRGNENKNVVKHGVSNKEAEQVFFNNPIIFDDKKHSTKKEQRYYALGRTNSNKLPTIVFTIRNNNIRVISARPMGKREKEVYV